jgi:hypothetical protein
MLSLNFIVPGKHATGARAMQIKHYFQIHTTLALIDYVALRTGFVTTHLRVFVRWTEAVQVGKRLHKFATDYSSKSFMRVNTEMQTEICAVEIKWEGRGKERMLMPTMDGWMDG